MSSRLMSIVIGPPLHFLHSEKSLVGHIFRSAATCLSKYLVSPQDPSSSTIVLTSL